MTYFNLLKENVLVNQVDFIEAVNKGVEFSITHEGDIVYTPIARPVIFTGKAQRNQGITTKPVPITETLGRNYNITLKGPQLEIKASTNWQDIIGFNMAQAHYDDSTGDGISVFGDKEMEAGQVTVRLRDGKNLDPMSIADLIVRVKEESAASMGPASTEA